MKSHCLEKAKKVVRDIEKCIKATKMLNLSYDFAEPDVEKFEQEAETFIDCFVRKIKAVYMNYDNIEIEDIFNDYFKKIPPFEEKKKSEFPDAVISTQIKLNFNNENPVVVISNDNGIKRALNKVSYCIMFSSLSELFDHISQTKDEYEKICETVYNLFPDIQKRIEQRLDDDTNISLDGVEYDTDGISIGFDYEDIYYLNHKVLSTEIFTIEYFDKYVISTSLKCTVSIEAECTYDDYENAVWDSEEKEYLFLNSYTNIEKHKAIFVCKVLINRKADSIDDVKFHVCLGGDSRVERFLKLTPSRHYNTCPDCGQEISIENEGANGFCVNCADNH